MTDVTRSRTTLSRYGLGAVAAATAALVLSSCSSHPGDAARVGSTSISGSRVDAVARSLCSAQTANPQSGVQQLTARAVRDGALSVLIDNALTQRYADSHGLEADQAQVSAAVAANQSTVAALPASRRPAFRSTLQDFAESNVVLTALGKAALDKAGTTDASADQQAAEGTKIRNAWARTSLEVSVDPRFGRFRDGALSYTSGSLSVPASSQARAAAATSPSSSYVSGLPASQQCD